MGYDVHITRASHWVDSQSAPISLAEWIAYLASDLEMRQDNYAEAKTQEGETVRYENQGLAVWLMYSGHGKNGNMAWFDLRDGNIVVKNPDEEILGKMRAVAIRLRARVQGDDGEFRDGLGEPSQDYGAEETKETASRGPWWKRIFK